DRLLWVRGHVVSNPGMCRDMNQRAMEQAVRALTLVLQAGTLGLVVLDVSEAPVDALRRLPFTTWLRLQRMIEGRQTMCVVVGNEPMARSSAGLTVLVGPPSRRPASAKATVVRRSIGEGGRRYGEVAPKLASDPVRAKAGCASEGAAGKAQR